MGGITTGIGLFSGIDTATLIQQLLSLEARPKALAQRRMAQLQLQQTAFMDVNARMSALRTAASGFRTNKTFSAMAASSSNANVLTATAGVGASPGSYSFVVDRLVSSQQLLSRGFADRDVSSVGATAFTFESAEARLDRDVALADFNGGEGVKRGKIVIAQGSSSATIDLSKAVTVNDVIDAINAAAEVDVTASVSGGRFVMTSTADFSVSSAAGFTTAESLGIKGSSASGTLNGTEVYYAGSGTALAALNDGNGVFIGSDISTSRYDFAITIDPGGANLSVNVNIGSVYDSELNVVQGPVSTLGGVIERINAALTDAGLNSDVSASLSGGRVVLTDAQNRTIQVAEKSATSSTVKDLGILGSATGTLTGRRILAGLNTTLVSNLNGGSGIAGDGTVSFTARDGTVFSADLSGAETIRAIVTAINDAAGNGGRIVASLNGAGNGLLITDTTGGGSNLIVTGETAESLGIATDPGGVASSSVQGTNLQHRYVTLSTRVADLNGGRGIGTGTFRLTDGSGKTAVIDIGTDTKTLADLIQEMNAQASALGLNLVASINANGDGLLVREKNGEPEGGAAIKIEDLTGTVAKSLRIAGTAAGTGDDNFINGSYETTVEFDAADTLDAVVKKINEAGVGVRATIINDGTGSSPFRISLVSAASGRAGRFILDDGGLALGLETLNAGEDARVFFGSSDPAKAVLLTSSTNTLDTVVTGVTIDLHSTNANPVTLTVSRDTGGIEKAIDDFISAYNAVLDRVKTQTKFDPETNVRGPLLGDSTVANLLASMQRTILGEAEGVTGRYTRLTEVGVRAGEGGKLSLDRNRLREAMETDFAAVQEVFAAREVAAKEEFIEVEPGVWVKNTSTQDEFSKLGVLFRVEELAKQYVDSVDGVLRQRDRTLTTQIELQSKRIEAFDVRLEQRRKQLEAQFLAMERALAALQSQQSALAGISSLLGAR
ncbi:MAG TPA: flagellar filament capping protein FliD [Phycisphaerales bacterium]|nr:flagellar filament capping protein FliD [Phycisphaerales bacterium]